MGKIVKYCVSCDEGFAEKFGFCPSCGAQLQSFEMNPVAASEEPQAAAPPVPSYIEPEVPMAEPVEAARVEEPVAAIEEPEEVEEVFEEQASAPEEIEEIVEEPAPVAAAASSFNYYQPSPGNTYSESAYSNASFATPAADGDFHVTVIQEKNDKRNALLLGATALMLILTLSGTVVSLYRKDLNIGAIDNGDLFAYVPVVEEVPMDVEEEKKLEKEDGGGGGGGGRDEKTPTSQGRLATQTEKPLIAPDKSAHQMKTDMPLIASTQGNRVIPPTEGPYGDPNSKYYIPSNGQGSGGGQGSGYGTGQGSGNGTGMGSGTGSGSGGGNGTGNGDGDGAGGRRTAPPPAENRPAVTTPFKILSKPRPGYTDAARSNNIQGTVTLRITFLANGQIGGVSAVSGLPHGLTDKAIAAARSIRFEPQLVNGVPQSVTRTLQYTFTIY